MLTRDQGLFWFSHTNHQPFQWYGLKKVHGYVAMCSLESQYLTDKDQENPSLAIGENKTNSCFRFRSDKGHIVMQSSYTAKKNSTCSSCTKVVSFSFVYIKQYETQHFYVSMS